MVPSRQWVRWVFAALLLSVVAVAAMSEDGLEDLLDDGVHQALSGQQQIKKGSQEELPAVVAKEAGQQSAVQAETVEADDNESPDLGEGMDDDLGESAAVSSRARAPAPAAAPVALATGGSAESVVSGANKFLCYKAGTGEVGAETLTIGLHYVRCDVHATCDPSRPACTCKTGYTGDGGTCNLVDCKDPIKVTNGLVKHSKTTYGSQAFFECNYGYVRKGPEIHTCLASGKWTEDTVTCEPRSCGPLSAPPLSEMTCTGDTFQKTCETKCKTGYRLVPPTTKGALEFVKGSSVVRTCGADGLWSGFKMECKIVNCPRKEVPVMGFEDCPDGDNWKAKCNFRCEEGYHLASGKPTDTMSSRTCQADGSWSGNSKLSCEVDQCPKLSTPANGKITCTSTSFRGQCAVVCDTGYELNLGESADAASDKVRCEAGGKWNKQLATCKIRDCGKLDPPDNGAVSHNGGTTYLQKAQYTCNTGHYMSGAAISECAADGKWTTVPPVCTIYNCGELAIPDNTDAKCTGTNYGHECSYTCHVGHSFKGTKVRKCMADGLWSGQAPMCTIDDCGGLSTPSDAFKACTATTYGKECVFACKEGYYLVGDERRTCQAGGKWSGNQPRCAMHTCGAVPDVANGKKVCDGTGYRKKCDFKCNDGYERSGRQDSQCDYDYGIPEPQPGIPPPPPPPPKPYPVKGMDRELAWYGLKPIWVGTPTVCTIRDCKAHPPLQNGKNDCTGTTYGQTCKHTCNEGYVHSGSAERKCNKFGDWSGSDPKCTPVDCGKLPNSPFVTAKCGGQDFKKQCLFGCEDEKSHVFKGSRMRECTASGAWSGVTASCEAKKCGEPEVPMWEGKVTGTMKCSGGTALYHFGSQCAFTCNAGHTLSGSAQRTCGENSTWTGEEAICKPKECGELPTPKHGGKFCTGTTFADGLCTFNCRDGYVNKGSAERKCDENGKWTGKESKCEKQPCEAFAAPENAEGYCTGPAYQDKCTYTCKKGYTAVGAFMQECRADKKWSNKKLECHVKDCGKIAYDDPNLVMSCTGTTFGKTCSFSCPAGYDLMSGQYSPFKDDAHVLLKAPYHRQCKEDATWSNSMPHCKVKDCGVMAVKHAEVKCDGTTFGKKCTATCLKGYTSAGSVEHTCTEAGVWSGTKTVCTVVSCGDLTEPKFGTKSCEGTTYSKACSFGCNEGYELSGDAYRTCQEDGKWTGSEVSCKIISCPTLNSPTFGLATCTGVEYDKTCSVSCNPGYSQEGSKLRTCRSNKLWDGTDTTCTIKDCGDRSEPSDGTKQCSGTKFGDTCKFACNPGFTFSGSKSRKCNENAEWDGKEPTCTIKDCGSLQKPENAEAIKHSKEGTLYGATATYKCNRGYRLIGNEKRKCGTTGLWDGSSPKCELIKCPPLKTPTDGRKECTCDNSDGKDCTYEKICTFGCNKGHTMEGSSQRTCQNDGSWSGADVTCKVVDCGGLETPEFASKACTDTTYGKTCKFKCQKGYDLVGPDVRTCSDTGKWSGAATSCRIKTCGLLAPPENGSMDKCGSNFGSVCTAKCNEGYTFCGSHTRRCDEEGKWDGKEASCKVVDCGDLKTPKNGAIVLSKGTIYKSVASISCNPGYTLIGSPARHCLASGKWDGVESKCKANDCGPLPDIARGKKECTGTTFGHSCKYTCEEGHELSGSARRECSAAGEWDGKAPSCRAHNCGEPKIPENGQKHCDGTKFGSKCTFKCQRKFFKSAGDETRTCNAAKEWSGSPVQCSPVTCQKLHQPAHGSISCNNIRAGGRCMFACNEGYDLSGAAARECTDTGTWSGTNVKCTIKDCGTLATPSNAVHKGCTGTTFGGVCDMACLPGYDAIGDASRECQANGKWNKQPLTCVVKDCGEPPKPQPCGSVTADKTTLGGTATYQCKKGWKLQGSATRTCREDGKWGGAEPTCKRVPCGQISGGPKNGKMICDSETHAFETKCDYSCNVGYNLHGKKQRVCLDNGSWDVPAATCQIATCPILIAPSNGELKCDGSEYNSQCLASCNPGYQMSGKHLRTCGADGKWCHTEAKCHIKDCGALNAPDNGEMDCTGTTYEQVCSFKCKAGYRLSGQPARTCRADGKWSGSETLCKPRDCGQPEQPLGGTHSCAGTTYGQKCTFSCSEGLKQGGSKERTCGEDGQWSGTPTTCAGLTLPTQVYVKAVKWKDFLHINVGECQNKATETCKCLNFKEVHPEWGLNSECCSQPAQKPGSKPWCYCQDKPTEATECEAASKPPLTIDHNAKGAQFPFKIDAFDSSSSAHLKYGEHIVMKTHDDQYYLRPTSAGHIEFVSTKEKKSQDMRFKLVKPTDHQYRGAIQDKSIVGFKADTTGKYLCAEQNTAMKEKEVQLPVYNSKECKKWKQEYVTEYVDVYDKCCTETCAWKDPEPTMLDSALSFLDVGVGLKKPLKQRKKKTASHHRRSQIMDAAINSVVEDAVGDTSNLLQESEAAESTSLVAAGDENKAGWGRRRARRRRRRARRRRRRARRRRATRRRRSRRRRARRRRARRRRARRRRATRRRRSRRRRARRRRATRRRRSRRRRARRRRAARRRRSNRRRRRRARRRRRRRRRRAPARRRRNPRRRRRRNIKVCTCVANSKCKTEAKQVLKITGCAEVYPLPGKFTGWKTAKETVPQCSTGGMKCVVVNRPHLYSWEEFELQVGKAS